MHQLQRARFGLRWKVFLHIDLAESFAQLLIGGGAATLPARANFLGSSENPAIEGKILLHEGIREKRRGTMDELPAIVGLPVGKRYAGQHAIERFEEIGLPDINLGELRTAHRLEICIPGKVR